MILVTKNEQQEIGAEALKSQNRLKSAPITGADETDSNSIAAKQSKVKPKNLIVSNDDIDKLKDMVLSLTTEVSSLKNIIHILADKIANLDDSMKIISTKQTKTSAIK